VIHEYILIYKYDIIHVISCNNLNESLTFRVLAQLPVTRLSTPLSETFNTKCRHNKGLDSLVGGDVYYIYYKQMNNNIHFYFCFVSQSPFC